MKFEVFKFENVTSTNDIAINLIKEKKRNWLCLCRCTNKRERYLWEKVDFSKRKSVCNNFFSTKK